jgi:hypothetical protein
VLWIGTPNARAWKRRRVERNIGRTWGPYLSDRQWGTVREDYSATGEAWEYFPFEHARSRAFRWGEDGIFGISDDHQRLCFAPAFWNGNDPIVKERLFGLSGPQGNHGEDVKELYYYLDNVPSHAYMRALYKYPHAAFPYADLVATNARRSRADPEYELIDTGIFNDDAYFDIEVEYAKRAPADICIRITATNRGRAAAPLHIIPQLWFRNEWSWSSGQARGRIAPASGMPRAYVASHAETNDYWLYVADDHDALYCENGTNAAALFGVRNAQPYVKDGIDRAIRGEADAVNPQPFGSKLGLHIPFMLVPGEARAVHLRLSDCPALGDAIDATFEGRSLKVGAVAFDRLTNGPNSRPDRSQRGLATRPTS